MSKEPGQPDPPSNAAGEDDAIRRYSQTFGVTQTVQRDIVQFLSAKHTKNATLSVQEVMKLYACPEARARKVIANLVKDDVLVAVGADSYKVIV